MKLKKVETLSKEVGQYQLKKFNEKLNLTQKTSYLDLVSEVDKNLEKKIVSWIEENFPEHSILAEEGGSVDKDSQYKWVIDPLDGTTNYIHGFPVN